jgi:hypothetical protein
LSNLVYFSHSYRPRDAPINDYFARLMETEGLVASLDPPSSSVNSAKLERHLGHCEAMVVVLTERESGASPHILYEIGLGLRARRPLLVFVEDTLPSDIVPARVLQRRFSFRSFPRNVREHRQSLATLRDYIGDAVPRYQESLGPRTCLLLGTSALGPGLGATIQEYVQRERRYATILSPDLIDGLEKHPTGYSVFGEISLVIAFGGADLEKREVQLLGEVRGASLPLISFAADTTSSASSSVPAEYRPRILNPEMGPVDVVKAISTELEIYEQDFLELPDSASADRYTRFLIDLGGRGRYSALARERGVEVIVGDRYDVRGQAGAVGPNAHVHDVSFNQIWSQRGDDIELPALADELTRLRAALREQATTPDDDRVVADVGQAELSAKSGDGPAALRHLRSAGTWALETATAIGVGVAAAAIKAAAGL